MGKKKDKKAKKGKGAEKTAAKTERKAEKKTKKLLAEKGEDDIEALLAEFAARDKKVQNVQEEKVPAPSPRCNLSMTPHPDKDELIFFGGEYFNGSKTFMYNDLLFFNIRTQEWTKIQAPNPPPPRCAHQAVALHQGGGQLWIFGGEFASPTQSQFYHYKDLWVYHIREKRWDNIKSPGAPSARSGHRMTVYKRQIIVFGGFHDNIRDYKYFNDVHAFNLDTFTWSKLEPTGNAPSLRSACQIAVTQDQSGIIIYGGYSKERVKKDVDKGHIHTDMYMLMPDSKSKDEAVPTHWKWQMVKQHGARPSPRCGFTLVPTPGNRALFFGGVFDEEEDEENVNGVFYNDMYTLELDKGTWHEIFLKGKKDNKDKKRRRRKKGKDEKEGDSSEEEMEEEIENLSVGEKTEQNSETDTTGGDDIFKVTVSPQSTFDDGIFSVTVGGPSGSKGQAGTAVSGADDLFMPRPRMNALLAVKHGILYLYGGMVEEDDRQITLSDMYALDLHKLDQWNTLIQIDEKCMEWHESDSSSDSEDEEEGATSGQRKRRHEDEEDDDCDESESDDESDEESDMEEDAPEVHSGESPADYFGRTKDFWLDRAEDVAAKEGIKASEKKLKKAALMMAEEHVSSQTNR